MLMNPMVESMKNHGFKKPKLKLMFFQVSWDALGAGLGGVSGRILVGLIWLFQPDHHGSPHPGCHFQPVKACAGMFY